ncbi:MAG: tRNA (N6-threonylcarbamoyladenosine(37)-N6)-methyltransferase TrmO [Oscillospiraceae bacterium]|nr:tRNA (N6-threonylcarbamoyladenosine(37)-N6)-methyltransferase TrmO [Oscillospiraceae bacterium]
MISLKQIGVIRTDFPEKFGIPRQSGLVDELRSTLVFEPEFRVPEALRGIEQFSHLWLIWEFSKAVREGWSPTVRPPRLGGNTRMGVFATRSPFRPNPLGLSCVRLVGVEYDTPEGAVLHLAGADIMDGTPVYDIKPYLPYVDSRPDATNGFALAQQEGVLNVAVPEKLCEQIPPEKLPALKAVLAQDPRPQYISDPEREYTMSFAGYEISFTVDGTDLTVTKIRNS